MLVAYWNWFTDGALVLTLDQEARTTSALLSLLLV